MITFTDGVIRAIATEIASHEPERGGALLGPPGYPMISTFVFDVDAEVTRATYFPSTKLANRVQSLERNEGLTFKGIVHSHPGGFDRPSGPDEDAFQNGLDLNPRMSAFIAPIVTLDRAADPNALHEIATTKNSRMTIYTAYRTQKGHVAHTVASSRQGFRELNPLTRLRRQSQNITVEVQSSCVMPIETQITEVAHGLAALRVAVHDIIWGTLAFNGIHFLATTLATPNCEIIFLTPPTFPISAPVLLVTPTHGINKQQTREVPYYWSMGDGDTLWSACGDVIRHNL